MAVAGAVVVPVNRDYDETLRERIQSEFSEVDVKNTGEKGIALVIEAGDVRRLKEISEEINGWDEVLEFELAYLNWEEG